MNSRGPSAQNLRRCTRLHDTRHDFATKVRRSGEGLDVVAPLLGHSSLQMSARYAHRDDAATRAAAAKVTLPTAGAAAGVR